MPNTNAAANTGAGQIFDLWLSQWRLAILDSNSARPILAAVLSAMLARSGEEAFWECLQEFLEAQKHASAGSSAEEMKESADLKTSDVRRWLVECVMQLPARQAKRLLEHLSNSYSLHGEDETFWRIVEKALNHAGIQPQGHTPHRTI